MTKIKKLAKFGAAVLEILETQHEWSADTLDDIAGEADDLGLAFANDIGDFERTEEGVL
jgi:hypothetical protein